MEALKKLLRDQAIQVVILGSGDAKTVGQLKAFARANKKKLSFVDAFDEGLARRIYAGVDVLVVPSKFEPCGLTQMIAMRYGTLPLVRSTGGLKDTVSDNKTGFVFDAYTGAALADRIEDVMALWRDNPKRWQAMIARVMQEDVSWRKSARLYKQLYSSLLGK